MISILLSFRIIVVVPTLSLVSSYIHETFYLFCIVLKLFNKIFVHGIAANPNDMQFSVSDTSTFMILRLASNSDVLPHLVLVISLPRVNRVSPPATQCVVWVAAPGRRTAVLPGPALHLQ